MLHVSPEIYFDENWKRNHKSKAWSISIPSVKSAKSSKSPTWQGNPSFLASLLCIAHYSTLSMLVWILSVYPSTMCVKWWRWWHWVEDQGWLGFSKVFAKIFSSIDEDVKKEELNKENLIKISNRRKLFLECYKHEYQGVSTFLHQPTLSTNHPNTKNFYCLIVKLQK